MPMISTKEVLTRRSDWLSEWGDIAGGRVGATDLAMLYFGSLLIIIFKYGQTTDESSHGICNQHQKEVFILIRVHLPSRRYTYCFFLHQMVDGLHWLPQ